MNDLLTFKILLVTTTILFLIYFIKYKYKPKVIYKDLPFQIGNTGYTILNKTCVKVKIKEININENGLLYIISDSDSIYYTKKLVKDKKDICKLLNI